MHESFARLKPCVAHFSPLHPPVAVNMNVRRNRPSPRANSDASVTSIWIHRHAVGTQTSPPPEESSENRSALAVPPITIGAGDVFLMEHRGERNSFVRLNEDGASSLMTLYRWESVPKIATPLKSTWSVTGQNNLTFTCRCYDENDNTREALASLKALTETGWEVFPPFGGGLHRDQSRPLHRDLLRQ